MSIFKEKIHLLVLLVLITATSNTIFPEFLTIGSVFSMIYFLPIYLLIYAAKASPSRDILKYELTSFTSFDDYMKVKFKENSRWVAIDIAILIIGAMLLVWFRGGTLQFSHILLYFIALYTFTVLYTTMITWSKLALKSSIPVLLFFFLLATHGWIALDANPYLNPFVSIYHVFAKIIIGYNPNRPVPYNPSMIFAFFISLSLLFIGFIGIAKLKKRWMNL